MEKYYITSSIAYTSGKPHIGNTYEAILSDAIARYKRFQGYDVYFQTGTDEHGEKIAQKALENNMEPQAYVDKVSNELREIWDLVGTSYDSFVRTTDPKHKKVVQNIFKKLYDQGDIYLSKYEGKYCVPCESYFTSGQLVDGRCPDCGSEVVDRSEDAYFLKLSKYQDKLRKHIEDNPDFLKPESRKNEIIKNFLEPGLQDLSVSRTSFDWGIDVEFAPGHVVYVWIDALSNYISNIGYDTDKQTDQFDKLWPANLHVIGKDIIRFHAIYWPVILMALGLDLPKQIYGHPWLLVDSDKMSKSKGNLLYADDLVRYFGKDAVRYYVLHEIPYANDGTITYELIIERINSDLANNLGNLVNRTISMGHKYFDGKVKKTNNVTNHDEELINNINSLGTAVDAKMESLEIANALEEIFKLLHLGNKYIDLTEPWLLAKDESKQEELNTVLYNLLELIRVSAVYLESFLPDTAQKIFDQLNTEDKSKKHLEINNYELNKAEPLFMRIDKEIKLKEIEDEA